MDALPFVDTLFKEYLLFRGFSSTLLAFNNDLAADPGCGFQAERISDLIFRQLIPALNLDGLMRLLEFLNMMLYSRLDSRYEPLVSSVEGDLLRLFLVTAHSAHRSDKVAEFFKTYGHQLLSNSSSSSASGQQGSGSCDWKDWFLLPYLTHPEKDPKFQVYFSAEWASLLEVSFRNFLSGVVRCLPLPAVLRFNTDRRLRLALQQQVAALQAELDRAQQKLAEATAALHQHQYQHTHPQHQEQQQQQQQEHPPLQQQQQPQQQEQQQQEQQQQQQPLHHLAGPLSTPGLVKSSSLHRREASLDDWQQQQQQQQQHGDTIVSSSSGSSRGTHQIHRGRPPSEADDSEGQEMKVFHVGGSSSSGSDSRSHSVLEGSAKLNLLPQGGPGPQAAAVQTVPADGGRTQQQQQQQQMSHRRAGSLGGISFEAGAAGAAAEDGWQVGGGSATPEQHQHASPAAGPEATSRDSSTFSAVAAATTPRTTPIGIPVVVAAAAGPYPGISSAPKAGSSSLSSSPVVSWTSSAAGMRPQHNATSSSAIAGVTAGTSGSSSSSTGRTEPQEAAAAAPLVLLPGPLRLPQLQVSQHHHHLQQQETPAATSGTANMPAAVSAAVGGGAAAAVAAAAGITCVSFSPSGTNVARASAGGVVDISSPPVTGLAGNPARHASVACGAPVNCISWDARADKLMLIGCGGGGGVRAWHADTRRIMADVPAEPGFPQVVALACCPAEPAFVVAANSAPLPTAGMWSHKQQSQEQPLRGRLAAYNVRSFKRSSVLFVPGDVALVSVAYSSSGSQLVVGTAAGTALLYEPGSRNSPVRVWQVAAVAGGSSSWVSGQAAGSQVMPVQVMWRPGAAGSSPVTGGSVLMLCRGVLSEWMVSGTSRVPLVAVDVLAAAAAALELQEQPEEGQLAAANRDSQEGEEAPIASDAAQHNEWQCACAVSPDGARVAVLCATAASGVLLLYDCGCSAAEWQRAQPQKLYTGAVLAGGGSLSWHSAKHVLVVGCGGSNCSLALDMQAQQQ